MFGRLFQKGRGGGNKAATIMISEGREA